MINITLGISSGMQFYQIESVYVIDSGDTHDLIMIKKDAWAGHLVDYL